LDEELGSQVFVGEFVVDTIYFEEIPVGARMVALSERFE
jgi:hypothetical protein